MATNTQHRWAEVIKAWADGKEIQVWSNCNDNWLDWTDTSRVPDFNNSREWRIKPEAKTGWINIYKSDYDGIYAGNTIYETKEAAPTGRFAAERIAYIQITYTEGEGL